MKTRFFYSLFICVLIGQGSLASTTFLIHKNGELVFGRNYDWVTGAGMVCTNQRGLSKTSAKEGNEKKIQWVSKYGSTTFNQYGKEFPTGGMNEKGLVVELMWLDGSRYPDQDDRPAVGVLQWIQFQLDNYATIDEVIASDSRLRISKNNPPLHYLVADANGNAATIEFLGGKMVVHKGNDLPFPVLTNNTYSQSLNTVGQVLNAANKKVLNDNSLERFTTACSMLQKFQKSDNNKPVVDYAFDILNNVSQGEFTKWSIVYDIKNKKVFFKTEAYPAIKNFSLNSFNFNCSNSSMAIDMNQSMTGNIEKLFTPFTTTLNRTIMEKAINESKSRVPVSDEEKESGIGYPATITCTL